MTAFTETINFVAAAGSLLMGISAIILLVLHLSNRKEKHEVLDTVVPWFMWAGLVISSIAIILSLVYSAIIGYAPCVLCWWQRAFIYPQVALYAIAIASKDTYVYRYTLGLSIVGLLFSLYHNYLDFGGGELISCGTGVSCTMRYVNEFGFVTIPLMSLISLLSLAIIAWIGMERTNQR